MSLWTAFLTIAVIGLGVTLLTVLRSARRPRVVAAPPTPDPVADLGARVAALEGDLDDLTRTLEEVRDELETMQRLVDTHLGSAVPRSTRPER